MMRPTFIEQLADVVFPYDATTRNFVMLSVAFDAAGSPVEQDVFTVAGVISSTDNWSRLERGWERVLIDAGVPVDHQGKPIPFHMTDFENRKSPFDDDAHWTNGRRVDLMRRLTGTMVRSVRARFSCSIIMRDWYDMDPAQKSMKHLPYAFGACICAAAIAEWNHHHGDKEPVAYLFEGGTLGEGVLFKAFDEIVKEGLGDKYYIGTRTKDDKKRPPLQAADVHAYEIRKHFINELHSGGRLPRKSFERLMDIPDGGDFVMGAEQLEKWNDDFNKRGADADGVGALKVALNKHRTTRWITV